MQHTQMLWVHALSARKNWVAHINWMNGKKSEAVVWRCSPRKKSLKILPEAKTLLVAASVKYEYAVNARFAQGLLQLLFTVSG